MGYQFVFWKHSDRDDDAATPQDVYSRLMEGSEVVGLSPIPVSEILSNLRVDFPSALSEATADMAAPIFWVSDDERVSIEFGWSAVHFSAEFRPFGPANHGAANRIIDVLKSLGCPVFDPQTGERFG